MTGIILLGGKLSRHRKRATRRGTGSRRGTARKLENIAAFATHGNAARHAAYFPLRVTRANDAAPRNLAG